LGWSRSPIQAFTHPSGLAMKRNAFRRQDIYHEIEPESNSAYLQVTLLQLSFLTNSICFKIVLCNPTPTIMHSSFFPLAFATIATGHGIITSPTARSAGAAMKAVCGQQVTNNLQSNEYGDIQQLIEIGASQKDFHPASCDVSLCKSLQFDDNSANIQNFTAGQVVPIKVDIQAKHTGTANVSIVDTASNTMISKQLIYFPVYASTATDIPKNQT
jgi:hypothetical protein